MCTHAAYAAIEAQQAEGPALDEEEQAAAEEVAEMLLAGGGVPIRFSARPRLAEHPPPALSCPVRRRADDQRTSY